MTEDLCSVVGCSSSLYAKTFCNRHYKQQRLYGHILKNPKSEFNEIIDKSDYYEIVLCDKKGNKNGTAKIDKEDLAKVKRIGRWHLDRLGYVRNSNAKREPTLIFMHNLIMNSMKETDHVKSGFKHRSDNRKKNLRKATHSQNMCNRSLGKNNTSGYKGVTKQFRTNTWRARITINKK